MPTLPWSSPDHAPVGPCLIMCSRLRLHRRRHGPAFLRASLQIRRQALRSDGCLGIAMRAEPLTGTFLILSAWGDHDSIDAFVRTDPHRSAMGRFRASIDSSTFTTWPADTNAPPDWDQAVGRIDDAGRSQGAGTDGEATGPDGIGLPSPGRPPWAPQTSGVPGSSPSRVRP